MANTLKSIKLKEVKRQVIDAELVAEIDGAMKDPKFRAVVREFVKRTTAS